MGFQVTDEASFEEALRFIHDNKELAYDTETTGLNVRKDTVIGFGVANHNIGFYVPIHSYDRVNDKLVPAGGRDYVQRILESLKGHSLITWNASFDMRITKNNLGVDLLPDLHCDALLLKHTCDEEFPFGLKEIATKLWGHDVKKEKEEMQVSIKSNGGTSKQYFKAATDILARYCVQDCLLTMRLYNHYSAELRRQGLESFYYDREVLPLYKHVTIPMEQRGVRMDVPKMLGALTDIEADIANLENKIQSSISEHLDAVFTPWLLNKDYPLSVFGSGRPSAWTKKYKTQIEAWAAENPDSYLFNLQSKHHLKKLFFDTLGCKPLSKTPTGLPQVDEDFLASIVGEYPWVSYIIEYNSLNKIKSTYITRFLDELEGDRFYPSWMQHRTVSGRYGGDLQQLPRPLEPGQASELVTKYTNMIREFIIPEEGCKLVSADYEQLEPTVFSHTSGDASLQNIFNSGVDFYSEVAIRTEGLQNVSSIKSDPTYLAKVDKVKRQKAKSYALGIAYGMTGYKLKFELGCSEQEADQLVKDYLDAFPGLASWIKQTHADTLARGYVETQTGRRRHLEQAKALRSKWGPSIGHDLELWKMYHRDAGVYAAAKADRRVYKNLLNNAVNFQVQGLAASIVNRAAIELAKRGFKIIAQIHDEIVFELPNTQLEAASVIVKQVMESILPLSVPLRTTPQIGNNYRECK